MRLDQKYKSLLNSYHINKPLRLAHFFAQIDHESGLVSKRESLYFKTIKGLRDTFYSPFKDKTDEFVSQYLKNSEKCANYVYANKGGNGNEASGDGFKYRGGGFIQNTFKNGYLVLSKDTRIDFVGNPDLILDEANAMIAACHFWNKNKLNEYADFDDLDSISDLINKGKKTKPIGDTIGYEDRKNKLNYYKTIFK